MRDGIRAVGQLVRLGEKWIDWLRARPIGLSLIKYGCLLIGLVLTGWAMSGWVSFGDQRIRFGLGEGDLPTPVLVSALIVGVCLVGAGGLSLVSEWRQGRRRRVIVVEVRGLRNWSGTPLEAAVPRRLKGQRIAVAVDLRQRVADGVIVEPQTALDGIAGLPSQLTQLETGAGRGDSIIVYGGLAPVPLTFLTGMLLDDEGPVLVLDWDRHAGCWRELDDADDGGRFEQRGVEAVGSGVREAALVVSVSYRVRLDIVRSTVGDLPAVELTLPGGTSDGHWSAGKQTELGRGFLRTVAALGNQGVERVHLFLAAPNSVAFRFGQLYDRRNLPEVVVYQYERNLDPPYPWGVRMPSSGSTAGALVDGRLGVK